MKVLVVGGTGAIGAPALRVGLRDTAKRIRKSGHRAVAFADDNSIVDRAVAHRAGLGWYGKNANLLLPGAGSWFVLGSIITAAEYEVMKRRNHLRDIVVRVDDFPFDYNVATANKPAESRMAA